MGASPCRRLRALAGGLAVVAGACSANAFPAGTTTTAASAPPTAAPLEVDGPGRYQGEVVSGGLLRRFVLVVPETAPEPAPLVVVFHGFSRGPEEIERTSGMDDPARDLGFVVAYPAGTGFPRRWLSSPAQGGRDVAFMRDLVEVISSALPIDPGRIYAAGMSNGGGMAARLACDAADLVAAVGPVAAAYPPGRCAPPRPVPVAAFHGTGDPIVPFEGLPPLLPAVEAVLEGWAARNGCDAAPTEEAVAPGVTRVAWGGCDAGADVVLYKVVGGGHGWPGSGDASWWGATTDAVDAAGVLLGFFAAHPMP